MPSILLPPEHRFLSTGNDTALLVLNTGLNPSDPQDPHYHIRFPQDFGDGPVSLGLTPGHTCTIQRVRVFEIIRVVRWDSGCACHESYEVLPGFELHRKVAPEPSYLKDSTGVRPCKTTLKIEGIDLEILFFSKWPEWLTQILNSQLRHWRIHNVEHFFRFTPWPLSEDDIWHCVKGAPYQAMKRYGKRLSQNQWKICCHKSPRGAAAFALDRISPYLRMQSLQKYPDEVLRNASAHLTNEEIIKIAKVATDSVLRCHGCMPGKQKAVALSTIICQAPRHILRNGTLSRQTLLESLKEFPAEWHIGAGGDFGKVFTALEVYPGSIHWDTEIFGIHRQLDPILKAAFMRAVSERI